MSKILVTGAAGFIGAHLADYLIKKGHTVVVVDDLSGGFKENVNKNAKFIRCSITNKNKINHLFKKYKFEYVYHLAAYAAEGLSHFIKKFNYEDNLIGSINLINASVNNNVKCFVFTSSMAVYGTNRTPMSENLPRNPEDSYGIAKAAVEMELEISHKMFGLNYVIFRPHNVYGPRQNIWDPYRNVIGIWMNRIMQGKPPLIFGDGKQTRAFSYIDDISCCIADAAFNKKAHGQIINIGASKHYTLNQLAEEVCAAMGTEAKPIHVQQRFEVKHAWCTTEKSKKILGFKDRTSLHDGLEKMAIWAKKAGPGQGKKWGKLEIYKNLPEFWRKNI